MTGDLSIIAKLLPPAKDIDAWAQSDPQPAAGDVAEFRRGTVALKKQVMDRFQKLNKTLKLEGFAPESISYHGATVQQNPEDTDTKFDSVTIKFSLSRPRKGQPGRVRSLDLVRSAWPGFRRRLPF